MKIRPRWIQPSLRLLALNLVLCGLLAGALAAAWGLAGVRWVRVGEMTLPLTRLWQAEPPPISSELFEDFRSFRQSRQHGPWLYLAQLKPQAAANLVQAYQQILNHLVGPGPAHRTAQLGLAGSASTRLRALRTTVIQRDLARQVDRIHLLAVLTDRQRFWVVDLVFLSPVDFPHQPAQIPQHYQRLFEIILNSLYVTAPSSPDTPV